MNSNREDSLQHFLSNNSAYYQDGKLIGFASYPELIDRQNPALSMLDQRAILQCNGPDTVKFLQGQVTCDVEKLTNGEFTNGAACTPQGRMLTTFTLLHAGGDHFLMAMHQGLLESTQKMFNKYIVFYKTAIDIHTSYICLGLSGNNILRNMLALFDNVPEKNQAIVVQGDGWLLNMSGIRSRYQFWILVEQLSYWWNKLVEYFIPVSDQHWRLLDCESVTPALKPEALGKYLPQHFNLPSLKSVSFRKGCYTGQEIVARMQNLGQQKRRCYRLTAERKLDLSPDTKLYNSMGKTIGEILDCTYSEYGSELLAVITVKSAEKNDVRLNPTGGDSQNLQCKQIPYVIDPKAELLY